VSVPRLAYTALVYALLPAALARLAWRGRREPGYREHIGERFGRYEEAPHREPLLWVHAVSVGETRAAEPLVRELASRNPDHRILLTHMTPTGRRTGAAVFGHDVLRAYLPYDYPGAIARFLDHYHPRAGVLLETEIWPNLVHGCKVRGIPLYLANARLSEKSASGYAHFAGLSREAFGSLAAVAAQTGEDAERLRKLGASNVQVTGNLKFDARPDPLQLELGRMRRVSYGARRVLLAASTRDGEEALLLDALPALPPDVLLVIVPRHPQRFDEVAALMASRGIAHRRLSAGEALTPDTRVLLGDSMGEMIAHYAACDIAFIGGSLLAFGAHNLIEACAVGTPVLIGPHTYNFAEAADKAIESGAALRVENAQDVMRRANALFADSELIARMGQRGVEFTHAHRGATERVMAMLEGVTRATARSDEAGAKSDEKE
jgi:3-deoxy-D-manno-octulosonic-acid transferase